MKKLLLILSVVMGACSEQAYVEDMFIAQPEKDNLHRIDLKGAVEIVNDFNEPGSRSYQYEVSYITVPNTTCGVDTLAYVFNYEGKNGFVVIATDDRVSSPVLAFSDEGHFSYQEDPNDIVYSNFVMPLASYEKSVKLSDDGQERTNVTIQSGGIQGAFVNPVLIKSLGQRDPYDKYVIEDYPGCPVGCVAVATCQIMLHCKDFLNYHDVSYNFEGMRDAITDSIKDLVVIPNGFIIKEYITYNMAIDRIAKIMFNIGQDVNMSYSPIGSGAYSADAISLLQNLGYTFHTPGFVKFNKKQMFKNLFFDKCILYVSGKVSNNGGHAWIIDGGRCQGDPSYINDKTLVYLHCDWGWDGESNLSVNADILLNQYSYPYIHSYAAIELSPSIIEQNKLLK